MKSYSGKLHDWFIKRPNEKTGMKKGSQRDTNESALLAIASAMIWNRQHMQID